MSTAILQSDNRPLYIDFNLYTDGDLEFKKELITLMIDNLKEIQSSLQEAYKQNSLDIFQKSSHKVKPTISMLEDKDLLDTIDEIKGNFSADTKQAFITKFNTICQGIIKSLEKENR